MTKDEARHVAAILNAWADGETIQICGDNENLNVWKDAGITFRSLMTCPHMYRIKPKPREWWIVPADDDWRGSRAYLERQHGAPNQIHVREVISEEATT